MASSTSRRPAVLAVANRQPLISLSVEGHDLRVVWVSGQEIVRWLSRPLDPALMPDGVVADPPTFGARVREILADYQIPRGYVVAGLHDTAAADRYLTLPATSAARLALAVERGLASDSSMGAAAYRYFHQVVERRPREITVYVLALRRAVLSGYVEGLRRAGVPPQIVEFAPHALIRGVNAPDVIIANAESTALHIAIVRNNLPDMMRTVPLADPDPIAVQERLLDELETIVTADAQRLPHPIHQDLPIALTGALLAGREVAEAVECRLGLQPLSLTCPLTAPAGFAVASFLVNLGLVLKAP